MPDEDLLTIGGKSFRRGECGIVDRPVGRLVSHAELDLRVNAIRGRKPRPVLFVTAGVHGDEFNGVEIARLLLGQPFFGLKGELLIVPVVNVSAFLLRSGYLPDRRDLNRLFPGNREGSLRAACEKLEMPYVLFEAGEALRLDLPAVTFGLRGVMRVMRGLGMLRKKSKDREHPWAYCTGSSWQRAPVGGLFRSFGPLGKAVEIGQVLGVIGDPFGGGESEVISDREGVIIGRTAASMIDEGDALYHVAQSQAATERVEERILQSAEEVLPEVERAAYYDDHADG